MAHEDKTIQFKKCYGNLLFLSMKSKNPFHWYILAVNENRDSHLKLEKFKSAVIGMFFFSSGYTNSLNPQLPHFYTLEYNKLNSVQKVSSSSLAKVSVALDECLVGLMI